MMRSSFLERAAWAFRIALVALIFAAAGQLSAAPFHAFPSPASAAAPQNPGQSRTQTLSNPLNDLLKEAQHDMDSEQYQSAIAPLQKLIAAKPDLAWAHFQLAYAYTALKRSSDARPEYERAIALDPKMTEAYLNLGILLTHDDPAAAVPPLKKAVELLPAQSRPRFLLGYALERSGDIPGAAETYEAALALDPLDLQTTVHLGNLYYGMKKYPQAEAKYRAALDAQPKSPEALRGLAEALEAQQKPEALAAYRQYLAVNSADSTARTRLIHLLLDQKHYDEALAELDRADSGKPPSLDSLRARADIQVAQKKWDDSIVTLQKAIAMAPADAQLHEGLGRIYMQKRDFPGAEKEIKTALQLDNKNLSYWKDLSSTYYLAGNYPAALQTLELISRSETPGSGEWFIRALCYDKLNQPKPALEAYEKFLALDQNKNPDQVWQAQQRSKVLRHMLGLDR
ncbi:MAG TPA: tetratricopeptide repeat protein [Candidatus Acidoferrum sp.]|nr:tetratricopeptide repeat protein [Candidatus Acidoferrum sp.]